MTAFLEITGRTEAEAIEKALLQLNLERDDVHVEVINRPKTGFLGFGAQPAKVKISYEIPDPPQVNQEKVAGKVSETKEEPLPGTITITQIPKLEPKVPENTVSAVENSTFVAETPGKTAEEIPSQIAVTESAKPEPQAEEKTEKTEKKPKNPPKGPMTIQEQEAVMEGILNFLEGLLPLLHVDATPKVRFDGNNFLVNLEGSNLGALIGRRGETLDAIQQITGYTVNKICPKRIRIYMDAEQYREKREETLIKLAEKVAGEAVKHRRNVPLEPMNAYERHIIHTALEKIPNVSTYSTGSDPNRRTVVAYRGKKKE